MLPGCVTLTAVHSVSRLCSMRQQGYLPVGSIQMKYSSNQDEAIVAIRDLKNAENVNYEVLF